MRFTDPVILATSTVHDGNMSFKWGDEHSVIRNRSVFLEKLGKQLEDCIVMEVEHGEKITVVDSSNKSANLKAAIATEALLTNDKSVVLFLITADCLPITLHDPKEGVIALAHLGWKPTEYRLIQRVVERMQKSFDSEPKNINAWIGPGIKKDSYIFSNPEQHLKADWQPFLDTLPSGEMSIDIVGFNKAQMLECGILEENIHIDPTDTAASNEYFSHYRAVRTGEPEGRFATIVALQ